MLTAPAADALRVIGDMSIRFWVRAFNNWARSRLAGGKVVGFDVDGLKLQACGGTSSPKSWYSCTAPALRTRALLSKRHKN